ncbi:hypothetical protein [Mycoplasmopsis cynos]|uniref:hypothetical protein n=1 Tax=Mycoplasmopsis cynos TaxID=171284 RepID=UPI002205D611|nr:hypothetical protein [Mycoplasmopsis cynos]UWV81451.1 hypothetical protein NW065_06000 [Mycoplasmopsis cynos]
MVKSKNGIRIGLKCPKKFPCLEAYDENDKKVAVDTIKRADKPTKIKLIPEKTVVKVMELHWFMFMF